MDTDSETLAERLFWLVNKLAYLEKNTVLPYKDLKFYPSEIHLMLLIDDGQDSNATGMAEKLGVTKGAISQNLSRLERKGVIEKNKDPYNKNEITVAFTPLGEQVLERYRSVRAAVLQHHARHLASFSESEREVIDRFLSQVEAILGDTHTSG